MSSNDKKPKLRTPEERRSLLKDMKRIAKQKAKETIEEADDTEPDTSDCEGYDGYPYDKRPKEDLVDTLMEMCEKKNEESEDSSGSDEDEKDSKHKKVRVVSSNVVIDEKGKQGMIDIISTNMVIAEKYRDKLARKMVDTTSLNDRCFYRKLRNHLATMCESLEAFLIIMDDFN